MSYECPRCRTRLVETHDEVNDYELEGSQVNVTRSSDEVQRAGCAACRNLRDTVSRGSLPNLALRHTCPERS
jgi:hypothetical protein